MKRESEAQLVIEKATQLRFQRKTFQSQHKFGRLWDDVVNTGVYLGSELIREIGGPNDPTLFRHNTDNNYQVSWIHFRTQFNGKVKDILLLASDTPDYFMTAEVQEAMFDLYNAAREEMLKLVKENTQLKIYLAREAKPIVVKDETRSGMIIQDYTDFLKMPEDEDHVAPGEYKDKDLV